MSYQSEIARFPAKFVLLQLLSKEDVENSKYIRYIRIFQPKVSGNPLNPLWPSKKKRL